MDILGREIVSHSTTFGNTLSVRVVEDVSAMSISPSGRDVVLASKQGLFVVDLDDPFSLPRWLYHKTSWEVADVQWSSHASRPYWVVSTSNQKAMVWNLSLPSTNAIEHVLHGHFRAITDINFHPQHPDVLATCSVDTYILNWDLRDPSKPSQLFSDWISGASQVKWNRVNPHILASSHDQRVHLWDDRKGSIPFCTIKAHSRKINGINFNPRKESQFTTCSSDGTVKFWDYRNENPQEADYTIITEFPVWRARYTPFGTGCVIMPLRGGNNSIYLVNKGSQKGVSMLDPVYVFNAHTEPVHEFLWRSRGGQGDIDDREFQLVTWSKDHDLRLWPVSEDILQSVDFDRSKKLNVMSTRRGAPYMSFWSEPLVSRDELGFPLIRGFGASGVFNGIISDMRPNYGYSLAPQYKNFLNSNNRYMSVPSALVNRHKMLNLEERQLQWLQGVRMGNRADAGSLDMFGYYDSEICSNLGEELGALANKFPKIRFEKINVSAGICIISMIGPWGENGEGVFIRLEIIFPEKYPQKGYLPEFNMEESMVIGEKEQLGMKEELVKIAEKFNSVGRGCLEACMRFLLDQVTSDEYDFDSLEQDIINESDLDLFNESGYLGNSTITDDHEEPHVISSDEEYIIPESESDSEEDEDNEKSHLDLVTHNSFIQPSSISRPVFENTPFALGCGARWGSGGFLICFFEKKERKDMIYNDVGIHKRNDRFKLRASRPIPLGVGGSNNGDDSSSSESESGSEFGIDKASKWVLTGKFKNPMGFKQRSMNEYHTSVNGSSLRSGGDVAASKSDAMFVGNIVSIKDYRHLIPSRRELALEYKITGDTCENLAKHNAEVAAKYGYFDVADCWRLLSMIDSISVPMSGVMQLAQNLNIETTLINSDGHYFWGSHPFGRQWMVGAIFNYFEKQHNMQMLANMSCLLSDYMRRKTNEAEKGYLLTPGIRLLTPFPKAAMTKYTREIYEKGEYFPNFTNLPMTSELGGIDILGPKFVGSTRNTGDLQIHSPVSSVGKHGSSIFSTTPEKAMNNRNLSLFLNKHNNDPKYYHDSMMGGNSFGLGAGLSTGASTKLPTPTRFEFDLYNNMSNSYRPSIKSHDGRVTQPSSIVYSDSIVENHNVNFNNGSGNPNLIHANYNYTVPPRLKVEFVNEDLFETQQKQNYLPLLDPDMEAKYRAYRSHYARILFTWGLQIESLEVMKFNFSPLENELGPSVFSEHYSAAIGLRPVLSHSFGQNDTTGTGYNTSKFKEHGGWPPAYKDGPNSGKLGLTDDDYYYDEFGVHNTSASRSELSSAAARGPRSTRLRRRNYREVQTENYVNLRQCNYCGLSVKGRFTLCLRCEHIYHVGCAADWCAEGVDECSSGCGCHCLFNSVLFA